MKKLLFALLFISLHTAAQNTVRVNTIIPSSHPDHISHYREPGKVVVNIQNLTNTRQEIYLRGEIKGIDNDRHIFTKPGYVPRRSIVVPAGIGQTVTVTSQEIQELYNVNNLTFHGTSASQIEASDRIGEGAYMVCVRAYDYNQRTRAVSAENGGCTTIFIRNMEAPMLIQPLENAEVMNTGIQNHIFSWTWPAGAPAGITYLLKIVEIFDPNRNPNDAYLSSTQPAFFEKEVLNNVYVYGPSDPPLVEGRKYAWAVTAMDPSRLVQRKNLRNQQFQNDGRSEIRAFSLKGQPLRQITPVIVTPKVVAAVADSSRKEGPDFTVPTNVSARSAPWSPVNCECKVTVPSGAAATVQSGDEIRVNAFTMKVTSVQSSGGGKYTGTGTIAIPIVNSSLARLRVKFLDLEVVSANGARQMVAGEVKGITRSDMSLLPNADTPGINPAALSSNDIHTIDDFLSRQKDQLVSNLKNSANSAGFELPIGIDKDPFTIGITQVFFTPTQAWFNAVSSMNIPDGNAKAAFEMTGACMSPTEFCGQFKLRLKEDLDLKSLGMKLVEGDLQDKGTYMEYDKEGFKILSMAIDYTFPGGIKATNDSIITARMTTRTTKGWSNWVAKVHLPDFYVDGVKSVTFSLGNKEIEYDHSDFENPAGMPAEIRVGDETYAEVASKTWHGFYLPTLTVQLPEIIKRGNNPIRMEAKNVIIDKQGFTGSVVANGIISNINEGSLSGWYASLDKVSLLFFKSGFRQSSMEGKVVLPASDRTKTANQIVYRAKLTNPSNAPLDYEFTLTPNSNMGFEALFMSVTLYNNSSITVRPKSPGSLTPLAIAKLNGQCTVQFTKEKSREANMLTSVLMPNLKFQGLVFKTEERYVDVEDFTMSTAPPGGGGLGYLDTEEEPVYFAGGPAAEFPAEPFFDSSSQPKVAGFTFSLTVDGSNPLYIEPKDGKWRVGLRFKGNMNFIEEVWKMEAAASFVLFSEVSASSGRIKWEGLGVKMDKVEFGAEKDFGAFKLAGAVGYYNKTNDEGFVGVLNVTVADVFKTQFRVNFGTAKQGGASFRYFDFNGMVDFGQTGFPIAPPAPISFYGFGGGVFYNMKAQGMDATNVNDTGRPADEKKIKGSKTTDSGTNYDDNNSVLALLNYTPGGLKTVPSKGMFGLRATVLIGLTARNVLDGDATFTMQFNTESGKVSLFHLNANVRVLTDISQDLGSPRNNSSTGIGKVEFRMDFERKEFTANAEAQFGIPRWNSANLMYAYGSMQLFVGGGKWWFYAGQPEGYGRGPNGLGFLKNPLKSNAGSNAELKKKTSVAYDSRFDPYIFKGTTYFEIGSKVDPLPGIPQQIWDIIDGSDPDERGAEQANSQKSKLRVPQNAGRGQYRAGTESKRSGMIVGGNTIFDTGESTFLVFYGRLWCMNGFDLSIVNGVECEGRSASGGPNGWYAYGQAYIGAQLYAGINLDLLLIKGKYEIFNAGAAAMVQAGLPDPTWVKGMAGARFSILDGLVKGNFSFEVSVGEQCKVSGDAFGGLDLIADVSPMQDGELKQIDEVPSVTFTLPVGRELALEDYTNADDRGNPKIRYFKFDDSCYEVTLNNQVVNNRLKTPNTPDEQNYLWYYGGLENNNLVKNTDYRLHVKAYLKEEIRTTLSPGLPPRRSGYEFVTASGGRTLDRSRAHYQERATSFRTNDGYDIIQDDWYGQTKPIHGHKSLPFESFNRLNSELSIDFKRVVKPHEHIKGTTEKTTYELRIFRNGVKIKDLPITWGETNFWGQNSERGHHDQKSFLKAGKLGIPLTANSSYVCLIVAKNPVQSSSGTVTKVETQGRMLNTNLSSLSAAEKNAMSQLLVTKTVSRGMNRLGGGEFIIGGYKFTTSRHGTLQKKLDNSQGISARVKKNEENTGRSYLNESGNTVSITAPKNQSLYAHLTITASTTREMSLNIVNSWLPKDAQGNYLIITGSSVNFPVFSEFSGERFSSAGSGFADGSKVLLRDLDGSVADPQWMKKTIQFLAAKTGLPVQRFKETGGFVLPDYGPECHTHSNASSELKNLTAVGGVHPTELPQAGGPSMLGDLTPMGNVSGLSYISTNMTLFGGGVTTATYQHGGFTKRCREFVNLPISDPVQAMVNKVINSRINPNPNETKGIGNQANVLNQAATWQQVNSAVNSYNQVNHNQMKKQAGNALMR